MYVPVCLVRTARKGSYEGRRRGGVRSDKQVDAWYTRHGEGEMRFRYNKYREASKLGVFRNTWGWGLIFHTAGRLNVLSSAARSRLEG